MGVCSGFRGLSRGVDDAGLGAALSVCRIGITPSVSGCPPNASPTRWRIYPPPRRPPIRGGCVCDGDVRIATNRALGASRLAPLSAEGPPRGHRPRVAPILVCLVALPLVSHLRHARPRGREDDKGEAQNRPIDGPFLVLIQSILCCCRLVEKIDFDLPPDVIDRAAVPQPVYSDFLGSSSKLARFRLCNILCSMMLPFTIKKKLEQTADASPCNSRRGPGRAPTIQTGDRRPPRPAWRPPPPALRRRRRACG